MSAISDTVGGILPAMADDRHRKRSGATPAPAEQVDERTVRLVARARTGDEAALRELFARYEVRLRRWAHGRLPAGTRGPVDTQDLVQDTLSRVFRRLHAFTPEHSGAFRDYVFTAMWNCIRDMARATKRRGTTTELDPEMATDDPSPLELAMGRETLARYEAALERLRPEDREAIVARVEMGLSHAEVAAALGKPSAAAAHMAVSRALMRLGGEMARDTRPR